MGESAWKTPTWYRQVIKVDISHLSRTFVCILMLATLRQGCQMSLLWYSQPRPRQPTLSFPGNKTNMHARANKDLHGTHFLITFNGERYSGFQKNYFILFYDSILSWCILMIRKNCSPKPWTFRGIFPQQQDRSRRTPGYDRSLQQTRFRFPLLLLLLFVKPGDSVSRLYPPCLWISVSLGGHSTKFRIKEGFSLLKT